LAETTLITVWNPEPFGPYVWSLLGGILDTLYLNTRPTPYYFHFHEFTPEYVIPLTSFVPQLVLVNDWMFGRDYTVFLRIGDNYSASAAGYLPDAFYHPTYDTVLFPALSLDQGAYSVVCSLITSPTAPALVYEDTIIAVGSCVSGWVRRKDICAKKMVKCGSDLTYLPPLSIYALVGNGCRDLVAYNILQDTWSRCESIPIAPDHRKKGVKRGCALTNDGINSIYAVKGNNTREFWRYDIDGDSWHYLGDCPVGQKQNGKATNLRNGVDMVYVQKSDSSLIFLLYGSKTFTFKAYWVEGDTWLDRANILPEPSGKPMAEGSCLTYDNHRYIYALKGKYGDFYRYDIVSNTWSFLQPMPEIKKKKMRDGTAIAYDGIGRIFATKGNTNEFWFYSITDDSWQQLDGPPNIRKLKGSSMCYAWIANTFYLLEGNKTNHFWAYVPEPFTAISENERQRPVNRLPATILKKGSRLPTGYLTTKEPIAIYNMMGQRISIANEKTILDFPSGIYFLKAGKTRFKLILID